MLVTGIILLLLGAVIAYLGRPREQLIFYAGVIIFVVGLVFVIIWALNTADANSDVDVALFGPLAWLLRKLSDRLDGQHTEVIPPGAFVFWSYAPTPCSAQWKSLPSTTEGKLQDGTPYRLDLN